MWVGSGSVSGEAWNGKWELGLGMGLGMGLGEREVRGGME